ncbi:MAG: hypothetical protein H6Q77_1398 [Gemmatimonadetes bacterium]|nr:hypothetical protein [Gemmatimonadota bacterium]
MSLKTWAFMRVGAIGLTATMLAAAPLHAGEKTDVLYMKNGDRLTCEIKSLDAGALYIGLDYVDGTISVNWSHVQRLESRRLFIVRMESGVVYTGTLAVADTTVGEEQRPVLALTDLSGNRVTLDKGDVVSIGKTSETFWRRFVVDVSGGLTYAKGNDATQYNLNSMVQYPRERWGVILNLNSTLSSTTGAPTSTRNQLNLGGYHLLRWRNYFIGGTGALLQSTEQGISLQSSVGGGVGYYLENTDHVRFSLLGGLIYQNTNYSDAAPEDMLAGLLLANLSVVTYSRTSLAISASGMPALSDPGRFFLATNATYYVKLWKDLKFNLSLYGNLDTRPPAGLSGSDYGFSSGLGWTFGSRQPQ